MAFSLAQKITDFRRRHPKFLRGLGVAFAFLTAFAVGYHSGVAETSRSPALVALALALAAVIVVIVDLDRPGTGLINVSEQPMIELRATLLRSQP